MCWVLSATWFSYPFLLGSKPVPLGQAWEFTCSHEEELGPGLALARLGLEPMFFLPQVLQTRFADCFWLSGRRSIQGHFGSSTISARGCYGQASYLPLIKKVCKSLRLAPAVITDWEEKYDVCLSDLVSYAPGYNDLRLLRIFIFGVSISLFPSLWLGKLFYGHFYGVLIAFDTVAHFCYSPTVSITLLICYFLSF